MIVRPLTTCCTKSGSWTSKKSTTWTVASRCVCRRICGRARGPQACPAKCNRNRSRSWRPRPRASLLHCQRLTASKLFSRLSIKWKIKIVTRRVRRSVRKIWLKLKMTGRSLLRVHHWSSSRQPALLLVDLTGRADRPTTPRCEKSCPGISEALKGYRLTVIMKLTLKATNIKLLAWPIRM